MSDKARPATESGVEKIKLVLQVISTAGIIFTAASVLIAYRAFRAQHDWNRRQYTMEVLRNYDRDAKHHSDAILNDFRGLIDASKRTMLSREQAATLYFATAPTQNPIEKSPGNTTALPDDTAKAYDNFKLRQHVVAYLNYMEFVCKAYEAQVVDQQIIYEAFNGIFIRRHDHFEEFIKLTQEQQGSTDSWGPIERVVHEWKSRNKERRILPKTG